MKSIYEREYTEAVERHPGMLQRVVRQQWKRAGGTRDMVPIVDYDHNMRMGQLKLVFRGSLNHVVPIHRGDTVQVVIDRMLKRA